MEEDGEAGFLSIGLREDDLREPRIAEQRPPNGLLGRNHAMFEFFVDGEIADELEDERHIRFSRVANVDAGHSVR